MSWYLTASISTLVRHINATYMYYDRVAVGREGSPSESVNPWCHDLGVFRVVFLKILSLPQHISCVDTHGINQEDGIEVGQI